MWISRLTLTHVRNLSSVTMVPHSNVNIISGDNGAGKTSLLEAIYLLALGRSFRTHQVKKLINYDADAVSVFMNLQSTDSSNEFLSNRTVAIQKNRDGSTELKCDGERLSSLGEVSRLLPVQFMGPDADNLIDADAKSKRRFLDWGVFHVEHSFLDMWRDYNRLLKQRNSVLRLKANANELQVWDKQIGPVAASIDLLRKNYFKALESKFNEVKPQFALSSEVSLSYKKGWPGASDALIAGLLESYDSDIRLGYTTKGPHRASLDVLFRDRLAKDVLSRGQKKNIAFALLATQIALLEEKSQYGCLILLDDLEAEFDSEHLARILKLTQNHKSQVFITTTDPENLTDLLPLVFSESTQAETAAYKVFHVEQGCIEETLCS